jgi:ElaB/YqjD/DUF883 family membrane-anchored ribosome-binding protein
MNDIARDLHALIDDAEELLHKGAREAGDEFDEVRERLQHSIAAGKARLKEAGHTVAAGMRSTDGYVHRNPWPVVGAAAAIALLAGWILGARR